MKTDHRRAQDAFRTPDRGAGECFVVGVFSSIPTQYSVDGTGIPVPHRDTKIVSLQCRMSPACRWRVQSPPGWEPVV